MREDERFLFFLLNYLTILSDKSKYCATDLDHRCVGRHGLCTEP